MIDTIECISLDFSNLRGKKEIEAFIPTQLIKYFPDPDLLIYDYIESGLVCYTLKENLTDNITTNLEHPLLLFKYILKKDGHYIVIYKNRVLEVNIKNKTILNTVNLFLKEYDLNNIDNKFVLISDLTNYENIKNLDNTNRVLHLENLYKKCKKDLFKPKKRNIWPFIFLGIGLTIFSSLIIKLYTVYNNSFLELQTLESRYNDLLVKNNRQTQIDDQYKKLLVEYENLKEQIPPDLYSVFFSINNNGTEFRVSDINYNNRFLRLNAISKNSIKLISDLNKSNYFYFIQNSTTTKADYEFVTFSGGVICP